MSEELQVDLQYSLNQIDIPGETLASFKQGIVGVTHPMNSTLEDSFDQTAM